MKLKSFGRIFLSVALAATLAGCGNSSSDTIEAAPGSGGNAPQVAPAAVYTLTNTAISNSIRQYRRDPNNVLSMVDDYPTGGNGDATDLDGTYGALTFQPGVNRFFAVNPGSNTISALVLGTDGSINILSTVTSNGARPVSVAAFGDLVYVLNYGNQGQNIPANISGYRLVGSQLQPIPDSTQALSVDFPAPAQIGFHPTGTVLVVTETGTNNIITYQIDSNGKAVPGVSQGSNGNSPAGFKFTTNGLLVVAEANNNVAGTGSLSVYDVGANGTLVDLSVSTVNGQTGTATVELLNNSLVYTANQGTDNISRYGIDPYGVLNLLSGVDEVTADAPSALVASLDHLNMYALNSAANTITTYTIAADGSLDMVNLPISTPVNAVGLVAR